MTTEIIRRENKYQNGLVTASDLTRHLSLLVKESIKDKHQTDCNNDLIIRSNSFRIDKISYCTVSDNVNNHNANENLNEFQFKRKIKLNEKLIKTAPIWYLPKLNVHQVCNLLKDKPIGHFIITLAQSEFSNEGQIEDNEASFKDLNLYTINEQKQLVKILIQSNTQHEFQLNNSKNKFKSIIQLIEFYILNEPGEDLSFKLTLPYEINCTFDLQKLIALSLLEQDFWIQKRFFNQINETKAQIKKIQFEETALTSPTETKTSSFSEKYSSISSTNDGTESSTRSSNSSLYRPRQQANIQKLHSILTHNSFDETLANKPTKPKKYLTIDSGAPQVIQTPPTPPPVPSTFDFLPIGKKLKRTNSVKTASKSLDEFLWPWKKLNKNQITKSSLNLKQEQIQKVSKSQASLNIADKKLLNNQENKHQSHQKSHSKKKSRLKLFGGSSTTSISGFFNSLFNRSTKTISSNKSTASNLDKSIQNLQNIEIVDDHLSINSCITIKNPFFGTKKSESPLATQDNSDLNDSSIYSSIEESSQSKDSKDTTETKNLTKIQSFKMLKNSKNLLEVDIRRSSSMYEPDSRKLHYRSLIGRKKSHINNSLRQAHRKSNDYSEPFDLLIDGQTTVPSSNLTLNSINFVRIKHTEPEQSSKTDSQITISNDYEVVHDCLNSLPKNEEITLTQINKKICESEQKLNESHYKSIFLDRTITFLNCESQFQSIKNYVYRLAQCEDSLFGKSILEFISCTSSSTELSPQVVISNTRQFMNGMKNYLIKNGGYELRQLIENERHNLNFKSILNIDSLIEECLQNIILKPLKSKIYYLLVDHQLDDTSLMTISNNVKKLNSLDLDILLRVFGIKSNKLVPSEQSLSNMKFFYQRLQNEFAPLVKIKYILLVINQILTEIDHFRSILNDLSNLNLFDFLPVFIYSLCKCGMYAIQIEMDYIWGLANRQLLNNETIYYLHLVSSACFILKTLEFNDTSNNQDLNLRNFTLKIPFEQHLLSGLLDVYLPDDKCEKITKCTVPLRSTSKSKDVCLLLASKLRVFNGEDYSLYLLEENGIEKRLKDDEQPLELKNEKVKLNSKFLLIYRNQKANIVWPKNISFS